MECHAGNKKVCPPPSLVIDHKLAQEYEVDTRSIDEQPRPRYWSLERISKEGKIKPNISEAMNLEEVA